MELQTLIYFDKEETLIFLPPAGFSGAADLWRSPDNIVVGWDLPDLLRSAGTAEGFTAGWTSEHCRQGRIICLVSTSSVQPGSSWLWYVVCFGQHLHWSSTFIQKILKYYVDLANFALLQKYIYWNRTLSALQWNNKNFLCRLSNTAGSAVFRPVLKSDEMLAFSQSDHGTATVWLVETS